VCAGFVAAARFLGGQLFVSLITGINPQSNVSSGRIIAVGKFKEENNNISPKNVCTSPGRVAARRCAKISLIIFYP
jgi:hypothetical protein